MVRFAHTRAHGATGETVVVLYLENLGFTILERNYTQRYGEIDIIAQNNDLIVFVEVKMRTDKDIDPGELVPLSKQKKLLLTAQRYMASHDLDAITYRFDVACVLGTAHNTEILYLPDAFNE